MTDKYPRIQSAPFLTLPINPLQSTLNEHRRRRHENNRKESMNNNGDGNERDRRMRKVSRERLVNYVHDIVKKQRTPLHEIIKHHALPFLPVKSLHRFLCVSKSWKEHISTPFFAHTQSVNHRSVSGFFLVNRESYPPSRYYPFDQDAAYDIPDQFLGFVGVDFNTEIKSSSHGLLCCSYVGSTTHYYICNPATKEWVNLPTAFQYNQGVVLVVDPSPLNFCVDYYLVGIRTCKDVDPGEEETESYRETIGFCRFSSKEGEWMKSAQTLTVQHPLAPSQGISVGKKAYWRTTSETNPILCYDPEMDMICSDLRVPDEAGSGFFTWVLGEYEGKLCLCCLGLFNLFVFVLEDEKEGGRWRKVGQMEVGDDMHLLGMEGGEVFLRMGGVVVGRDVVTGNSRMPHFSMAPSPEEMENGEFLMYVSSLAPVKKV